MKSIKAERFIHHISIQAVLHAANVTSLDIFRTPGQEPTDKKTFPSRRTIITTNLAKADTDELFLADRAIAV